jgi:hypothetical protein
VEQKKAAEAAASARMRQYSAMEGPIKRKEQVQERIVEHCVEQKRKNYSQLLKF